jgi:hypothetical protein
MLWCFTGTSWFRKSVVCATRFDNQAHETENTFSSAFLKITLEQTSYSFYFGGQKRMGYICDNLLLQNTKFMNTYRFNSQGNTGE